MRLTVIIPGLFAALTLSCLNVSRLNACDIGQNPYCTIDEIGPVNPAASDNTRAEANAPTAPALIAQGKSKHHRLSKSQRHARAAARDAMAKANDSDKAEEGDKPDTANIPAHSLSIALQPQASEYAPLFSVQAAETAMPILRAIIPVVDPQTYNEIDRMADASTSSTPSSATESEAVLNAMASMDIPDATPSEWRKWLPFGETSLIGQIFVALGGLLTLATAVRMIIV